MQRFFVAAIRAICATAAITAAVAGRAEAVPVFANGQGVSCQTCHTTFPGMTRYGMMVMMTNFQILDQHAQDQALPVAVRMYVDSVLGTGDQKGYTQLSDLSLLGGGFLGKDFTWYAEQHVIDSGVIGQTEQVWLSWNGLFGGTNSLQVGKFHTPFPFMPAHAWTPSGYLLAQETVGQNDFNPAEARWGVAFSGMSNEFMYNASYLTGSGPTSEALDFNKNSHPRAYDLNVSYGGMQIPWELGLVAMRGDAPVLDPDSGDFLFSDRWTRQGAYLSYQDSRWHFQTMYYRGNDTQPDVDMVNAASNGFFFEAERDFPKDHVLVRYDVASCGCLERQYLVDVSHNFQPNLALIGEVRMVPAQKPQILFRLAYAGPWDNGHRILSNFHDVPAQLDVQPRTHPAQGNPGVQASAAPATPAAGDSNNGAQLVQSNGCAGCHGAGLKGGGIGPALFGIEHKMSNDQIADFIVHPRAPMPNFGFTASQVTDIVAYLASLDGGVNNTAPTVTFSPRAPVDSATISVTFPGTPPSIVRVLPVMQMGTSTHHTGIVQLQPLPNDPHTFTGRIAFSMGGPWIVHIQYDGQELDVPVNVGT
ncbi:MAG TPA: cytochrome c [Candidatus Rubrimentiphilum sp.]|nr:cytochrome c [Candidatus Rubrimentiphilum sp.]